MYNEKSKQREKYLTQINSIIINTLKDKKGLSMLDIGCGTGSRVANIVRFLDTSMVYGIDISKEMVKIAKKKKQAEVADIVSLNLEDKNFDVALCLFNCFGYIDTHKKRVMALQNMNKHLKEGGILFIDVMNARHKGEGITFKRTTKDIIKDFFLPFFDQSLGFGNKRFTININNQEVAGFVHGFYDTEMQWILKKSGFIILHNYIIGYDSGEIKSNINEGQLFYICQKT